jgi:CO/xanthine dehydrogenase FAD-binding subunit
MIVEYFRPERIEEVLELINRKNPQTYPMGGGTVLNRASLEQYAVVDLQALGLDQLSKEGNILQAGATMRLHQLEACAELEPAFRQALKRESTKNLRQIATLAGAILSANGRSTLAGVLLACDVILKMVSLVSDNETIRIGELYARHARLLDGKLVTAIDIPLNVRIGFNAVARTPLDTPLVYAVVALWPSGRARAVLGGYGSAPLLVFDGPEMGGIGIAAEDAYSQAEDKWASAEYRREMAGVLTLRCLEQVTGGEL